MAGNPTFTPGVSGNPLSGFGAPAVGSSVPSSSSTPGTTKTATPSTPVSTSSGSGGASPFDYSGAITSDPIYQQTLANVRAMGGQDAATRAAAIRRYLIQYGQVPTNLGSLGVDPSTLGYLNSDVDQATRDLAAQNTQEGTSVYARMLQAHNDAIKTMKDSLAARGMLASGETGYGLGKEDQSYKNNQYDAQNSLLDNIMGAVSTFTAAGRQEQQMLIDALTAAAQRAESAYPYGGGPSGSSPSGGSTPAPAPTGTPVIDTAYSNGPHGWEAQGANGVWSPVKAPGLDPSMFYVAPTYQENRKQSTAPGGMGHH